MPVTMNPDYPNVRGCFIDSNSKPGKFIVVDYPTWHTKNGNYVPNANQPIADGCEWQKELDSLDAAKAFAAENNYVICQLPRSLDPKRRNKPAEDSSDDE